MRLTGGIREIRSTMKTKGSWNSLAGYLIQSFLSFVIVMTVVLSIPPYMFLKNTLEEQMEERGHDCLKRAELPLMISLSSGNNGNMDEIIEPISRQYSDVSYVAVTNEKGIFLAHSEASSEGKSWEGPGLPGKDGFSRREARYRGERVMELAHPIEVDGKRLGTLIVGQKYREVDEVLSKLRMLLGGVGLLVVIASLLSTRPFTKRITSGLVRLGTMANGVARGELREKVPEEGFEEIRTLAHAFNAMAENLRLVMHQIQEMGTGVDSFSSDFLTVIQDQAASASQQATSVAEVTATMEELSRTSRQIAQNAESVKDAASKSVEVAQAGTTLGHEGVEAMAQIKERVGDIARKTLFLGEKSHEIGKVMEIIKEIASEIHLLALNAAIESAAAGEHGRRFAVVASEVRRLAEKTRESTETIRGIIGEIQSATNSSVEATEQGTKEVEHWRETIRLSSEAFSEIIETIERTSEASTQISLATHQQTSANEQVVEAMRQIEEMVRVTASKMKESSLSASRLREMAGKLQEQTSVFRV
jgi:methyl-accepting chemotaxis protein